MPSTEPQRWSFRRKLRAARALASALRGSVKASLNGSLTSIEDRINEVLAASEPEVIRWTKDTWAKQRTDFTDAEISRAVVNGEIPPEWANRFHQRYSDYVNERLGPKWEELARSGASPIQDGVARLGIDHDWNFLDQRIKRFVLSRGGQLPVDLTEGQMRALRTVMQQMGTVTPVGHDELVSMIKPTIGLTDVQAGALSKFRASLEGEDLSSSRLEALVQARAREMHNLRAKRIARTEMAVAYNEGARDATQDVIDAGGFEGPVTRVWRTQQDERVCRICGPLDKAQAPMDGVYDPGGYSGPPAHPNCRCVEQFRVLDVVDGDELGTKAIEKDPAGALSRMHGMSADDWDPEKWTDEQRVMVNSMSLYTEKSVGTVIDPERWDADLSQIGADSTIYSRRFPKMKGWSPDVSKESYERANRVMTSLAKDGGLAGAPAFFDASTASRDLRDAFGLSKDLTVARGLALPGRALGQIKRKVNAGNPFSFQMRPISSWSTSGGISRGFADSSFDEHGGKRVMILMERSKGGWLGDASAFKAEQELVTTGKLEIDEWKEITENGEKVTYLRAHFVEEEPRATDLTDDELRFLLAERTAGRPPRPSDDE